MKTVGGKVVRKARQTAVIARRGHSLIVPIISTLIQLRRSTIGASRALNRRINLESASVWCRPRLAQEHTVRA